MTNVNTYLYVFAFLIRNHDLHDEVSDVRRNGLLADVLHEVTEFHRQAFFALLLADKRAPEHADTLTDHRDLKPMVLLEPADNVRERRVVLELEAIPKSPFRRAVLLLGCKNGLREAKEG